MFSSLNNVISFVYKDKRHAVDLKRTIIKKNFIGMESILACDEKQN